jgi:hypothetical protein
MFGILDASYKISIDRGKALVSVVFYIKSSNIISGTPVFLLEHPVSFDFI